MRTFLVLLILSNLGYFAWQQTLVESAPSRTAASTEPPFAPAALQLTLVSELSQERQDLMRSLAEARSARAQSQQQMAGLQQEAASLESDIAEVQEQIGEDQARSQQVQEALLDTLDAAIAEAEPQNSIAPTPWCGIAGIFPDQAAAQNFMQAATAMGVAAELESREEPVSSTWWVYMPPFESESAAMAMLAELQAKNIDSYYMRNGDMAGGISLGVFSRQESALIEQQRKAEQGYTASIRQVFRMGERLYVKLNMPDAALREAPEWTAFLASASGIELTENACEKIASENEFP